MKKKIAVLLSTLVVASTIAVPTAYVSAEKTDTTEANVEFMPGLQSLTTDGALSFDGQVGYDDYSVQSSEDFNVSLTDETGTGDGWFLKARLSNFISETNESPVLDGATISLAKGKAVSAFTEDPTLFGGVNPEIGEITLNQSLEEEAVITSAVSDVDAAQAGMGPWDLDWTKENIKLNVPAGESFVTSDTSATIMWTLGTGSEALVEQ